MKKISIAMVALLSIALFQNSAQASDKMCETYATGLAKVISQYEAKNKVGVKTAEAKVEEETDAVIETYLFEVSTFNHGRKEQATPVEIRIVRDLNGSNCRMWGYSLPTVN